jgi:predicted nucleic acid-binding protein
VIILDTNVLSEVLRPLPSAQVLHWLARYPTPQVFTTAITQAEILYGLELLPKGKRRAELQLAIQKIFEKDFAGRILTFDSNAAIEFAEIAAGRRRTGHPMAQFDAQIAAIALSRGATLATRNVGDFAGCRLTVLDPWAVG